MSQFLSFIYVSPLNIVYYNNYIVKFGFLAVFKLIFSKSTEKNTGKMHILLSVYFIKSTVFYNT